MGYPELVTLVLSKCLANQSPEFLLGKQFKIALEYSTLDKIKQQEESILKHVILSVLSRETSLYTLFFLVLE